MNVKDNKTKTEDSRIFSTTEKTKVEVEGYMNPREAWECMEEQVKYAYKVEDGLLDVIERQAREYKFLSMAYDIEQETMQYLEKEIRSLKTQVWEAGWGDDL
tara:strand:- start:104 stop:409 length:306 start_codon:yes stop_codon:yes gene_type:complete